MNLFSFTQANQNSAQAAETHPMIELRGVSKSYRTAAGDYPVLKQIGLSFQAGEFISIIGKSGSGKTTLLNMITGIDRPTSGEVWVNGSPLHEMSEGQMARWRGRNLGIVFQFFQLLPTLSILENILLAMDFGGKIPGSERRERALHLLDMVGLAEHAHKLPLALSGGQQQRVAIARALANDPPVLIADEPTGNLDSKTAESVFELFKTLVSQGKTIIIVTHDSGLAKRTNRTALIADGVIVNEYVARALPFLNNDQLLRVARRARTEHFEAGALIVRQESCENDFYIVAAGSVEVVLQRPMASDVLVAQLGAGQYFGEMELLHGSCRSACVRASEFTPVEVFKLDAQAMNEILEESDATREALQRVADERRQQNQALRGD
ncbi:MAG TPA: ATP-binding cassette domain-containing protein [Anaerolineales bacterium]|jgi:ABC-type lipoprotein export system ATPase subunit